MKEVLIILDSTLKITKYGLELKEDGMREMIPKETTSLMHIQALVSGRE